MIDNLTIEKIKGACNVKDFLEEDGARLIKNGVNWKCLCPFHDDRHVGSFVVSGVRDMYTCFSCGAHGNSIDYLMKHRGYSFIEAIRYAAAKYGIFIDDEKPAHMPKLVIKPHQAPPALPLLELPIKMVSDKIDTRENTFCNWLRSLPWNDDQRKWIEFTLATYMVGHGKEGHTIFWQIDEEDKLRTGKMMHYKPDGHRDKEAEHNFDWIHAILSRDWEIKDGKRVSKTPWYDANKYEFKTCLFGLTLAKSFPDATINIVESEKTAIICSIFYQGPEQYLWMATGGKQFFDRKHLEPLIKTNRKIICYPDKDGEQEWRDKVKEIGYEGMTVNTSVLNSWWKPEDGNKADIADILVRLLHENNKKELTTLDKIKAAHPSVAEMIDRLKLDPK